MQKNLFLTGKTKFRINIFGKCILMVEYQQNHKNFWRDAIDADLLTLSFRQQEGKNISVVYDDY